MTTAADFAPILIQLILAAGLAVLIVGVSHLLGQRAHKRNAITDSAYECGVKAEGIVHTRFSVKFYVTAMLFILFDIEVVFLIPWAFIYREFFGQQHLDSRSHWVFLRRLGFGSLLRNQKGCVGMGEIK